jgi:NADH:ubiquinone oxidoreductase subunit 6 (subunit J)
MTTVHDVFLLVLSGCGIVFATMAVLSQRLRRSAFFIWLCGLSVGAVFLCYGAEFLAFVQWAISTLIASVFIFYSMIFGEVAPTRVEKNKLRALVLLFLAGVVSEIALESWPVVKIREEAGSIFALGKRITENYSLALLALGFMLFLVVIGAGVIARPEEDQK